MAGFEVIVRPAILPNIRPTPRQSLPAQDDPEKGFAVIRGNPATAVDLTFSFNLSASESFPTETERTVDIARVYQKDNSGTVNKDNYIDLAVPTQIKMDAGPARGNERWNFAPIQESSNIEIKARERSIRRGQGFVD